jgi:hypothetical protein
VKKPADAQLLSRRKPKTDEKWMANQRKKDGTSTTATNDHSVSSPPKWITTSSKQQRTTSDRIGAATYEPVANKMHPNLSNALDSDLRKRKRRRTTESSRDRKQRKSLEDNKGPILGKNEKKYPFGGARTAEHSHLVVQDYETSAMLVQATQRKLRQNSNSGSCASRMGAHRSLTTGKSQLKLLSRSSAAALIRATYPASESKSLPNHNYDAIAHQVDEHIHQDSQHSKLKIESSLSGPVEEDVLVAIEPTVEDRRLDDLQPEDLNNACGPVAEQTKKEVLEDYPTDKNHTILEPATFEKTEELERIMPHKPDSVAKRADKLKPEASLRNDTTSASQSQEASMLSLPLCASSTAETHNQECPSLSNSTNATAKRFKECSMSPTLQDLATSLGPWRAIVQQEQGNQSSFRYALASLIVAKNEDKAADKDSSMWLPDLLEDGFSK